MGRSRCGVTFPSALLPEMTVVIDIAMLALLLGLFAFFLLLLKGVDHL